MSNRFYCGWNVTPQMKVLPTVNSEPLKGTFKSTKYQLKSAVS